MTPGLRPLPSNSRCLSFRPLRSAVSLIHSPHSPPPPLRQVRFVTSVLKGFHFKHEKTHVSFGSVSVLFSQTGSKRLPSLVLLRFLILPRLITPLLPLAVGIVFYHHKFSFFGFSSLPIQCRYPSIPPPPEYHGYRPSPFFPDLIRKH